MSSKADRRYAVLSGPLDHRDGTIVVINNESPRSRAAAAADYSGVANLAKAMDALFEVPGTRIRFGLDSLIGLIPGFGDVATAFLAVYILNEARRRGVSQLTMARMTANVAIDALGGSVPVLGDAFDVYWKSNQRNVDLLRRHIDSGETDPRGSRRSDLLFFVIALAVMLGTIALGVWVTVLIGGWLYRSLFAVH